MVQDYICSLYLSLFNEDHFGRMSKSKIAVGMETVQHAFGMSTMLLILPSMGAQLRRM